MRKRWILLVAALSQAGIDASNSADMDRAYQLMARAREAAQTDRNETSATIFAQVVEGYPSLRMRVLREYADQLLYSGRAAEAIPLFRETLRFSGISTNDAKRARRNLALAYLWSGRHEEAVSAYLAALRLIPGDTDLEKNFVEALIGSARHLAASDQNASAAARFRMAIERAPAHRQELLREFADQLTYSGDSATAVNLYRELISERILDGADPSADDLSALGLALLWSGQPDSARSAYLQVLTERPDDDAARRNLAESLVALARREASKDRNAVAADLLRNAIEAAPERRDEWLKEYADQLTYAERGTEAIPLYQELLAEPALAPASRNDISLSLGLAQSWTGRLDEALGVYDTVIANDPGNRTARLRRAEVLSWQERHELVAAELRPLLEADPDDEEVRRRLARAESYMGHHRLAIALARPLLESDPGDEEAAIITAESQRWMGRPDIAKTTLKDFLSVRADSDRAQELRDDLLRDERSSISIHTGFSTQSNGLDITTAGLKHGFVLNDGRTRLGLEYRHVHYDPGGGPDVDADNFGAFIYHRFNDAIEANSSFFFDFQDGTSDHSIFTHNTYFTIFLNDFWRIDLGASRETLDNVASLNLGLIVDSFSGSVDLLPTSNTKLTARASWSDYSDGNERWWVQAEASHRVYHSPDIWIGGKATAFEFSDQLNNGYFNPKRLQAAETTLEVSGVLFGETTYELSGSAGYEHADPDGGKLIWAAGAEVRYPVTDAVFIQAHANHSSSKLAAVSGFERTNIGLGVDLRW